MSDNLMSAIVLPAGRSTQPSISLVPVVRVTSAQSVAHQLLEMLRRGELRPGDQLPPEKELIETLAVGRSTVREALQILATLNIVQPAVGQGTFVRNPDAADLFRPDVVGKLIDDAATLELLEARAMIEPPCVRLAAIRGTRAALDDVERTIAEHERARRSGEPVSVFGGRFHLALAQAAGNRVAVTFMSSILGILAERARWIDGQPDEQRREIAEHRAILARVRAGDADEASRLMQQHIVSWAESYVSAAPARGESPLTDMRSRGGKRRGDLST